MGKDLLNTSLNSGTVIMDRVMLSEWKLTTDESVGETENLLEQALKQNKNLGQGLQSKLFYVACSCLASNSCKDYKD